MCICAWVIDTIVYYVPWISDNVKKDNMRQRADIAAFGNDVFRFMNMPRRAELCDRNVPMVNNQLLRSNSSNIPRRDLHRYPVEYCVNAEASSRQTRYLD